MDPQAHAAYKNKIGERLTRKLIDALREKKITQEELSIISSYILDNIDKPKTNSELLDFLEDLSQKWPIFKDNLEVEEAEINEENKAQKVDQVEDLIEQNKIEDAIKLASGSNDNKGGES